MPALGLVAVILATTTAGQVTKGSSGDVFDHLNGADEIVGGEVHSWRSNEETAWSSEANDPIVSLWVRFGSEVTLFVFPFFKINGTFSMKDDNSGVLKVASFEEDIETPADESKALESARRWKRGTELALQFDVTHWTIAGENVLIKFSKAGTNKEEKDGNDGGADDQDTALFAVKILLVTPKSGSEGVGSAPQALVRLDGETLFRPAAGRPSDKTLLLDVAAGKRFYVVLEDDASVRCKFRVAAPPKTANGERRKMCLLGAGSVVFFGSIPREEYFGREGDWRNTWLFTGKSASGNEEVQTLKGVGSTHPPNDYFFFA